jgi:hypothetical protein
MQGNMKKYTGENGVDDGSKIYEVSVSIYFQPKSQVTQLPTITACQVVSERNVSL